MVGKWGTQPNRFLGPQPCGYRAQSIATLQTAPDCPSQLDLSWEVLAAPAVPLAASIRLGLKARDGRAFPARTRSLNSARSPSQPAKKAASMAMSSTLRR